MEQLIEQIKEKEFKPLKFSIYGYMDDAGYIAEMQAAHKTRFSPDDFEYITFDLPENEVNGLKFRISSVLKKYNDLKQLVEVDIQVDKQKKSALLFIMKDEGKVFLVKLKEFDLITKLKKIK